MTSARATSLALLAVVGVVAAVGVLPVAATAGGVAATSTGSNAPTMADGNDSALGEQMSSFMQSSAAEANETVDAGMWEGGVADDRSGQASVNDRIDELDARIGELQREKATLREERRNDNVSELEYRSRMSRIAGQLAGIQVAIDRTETVGEDVGADVSRVAELRTSARNASAGAVAESMRGFDVDPPGAPNGSDERGPPDDPGNGGNGGNPGNGQGNGDGGGPGPNAASIAMRSAI